LRGVKQGGIEIVAGLGMPGHDHAQVSEGEMPPSNPSARVPGARRARPKKSAKR